MQETKALREAKPLTLNRLTPALSGLLRFTIGLTMSTPQKLGTYEILGKAFFIGLSFRHWDRKTLGPFCLLRVYRRPLVRFGVLGVLEVKKWTPFITIHRVRTYHSTYIRPN